MIITVLWEDQRGGMVKGFGPHELLVSCVADELRCARDEVKKLIVSVPKKGNGNVIRALEQELGIRIPDEDCVALDTVGALVSYLDQRLSS